MGVSTPPILRSFNLRLIWGKFFGVTSTESRFSRSDNCFSKTESINASPAALSTCFFPAAPRAWRTFDKSIWPNRSTAALNRGNIVARKSSRAGAGGAGGNSSTIGPTSCRIGWSNRSLSVNRSTGAEVGVEAFRRAISINRWPPFFLMAC